MALYDAENRKKKKDQVQRQTDTGTGRTQGQAKPGIVKPGAKRVSTPSPAPTPKPTTTAATVPKPGVTKGKTAAVPASTTTRQTDTGTGRKGTVRLETPKQTKEEKQAESRRRQRITEERQQAEASKKRLENNQKLMGEGKTSRYQQYVLGEKTRQYAQDLDEQSLATAIKQRQRDDALRNWNLDAAKKEREQISQDADKAKIALRSLTPQINYYEARGDHATADMLRQQQVALQQQVNKLAEFDRDYEQARSLQYDEAGGKVLDKLHETDSGAWNLINSLAQRTGYTSKDTGDIPVAPQQNGTFDIDPGTIEARTAKDDETRALLKKMGYADKDIEQMLNYRIRQINREIYENTVKQAKEFAQKNAAGASAVSVGTNIGAGLGFVDSAVQKLRNPDRPIDFYSDSNLPSAYTNAIREQVSQDLIDKYGEKGKVYSFLYQTGMSMADSGVNMMLGAAGMPEALGLAVMAGGAATSSMKEAHDRGLSDSQALKIGLISGIAEYGTEKIGLDAFLNTVFKRTKGSHAAARALLTNVFAEGGEEVASDMINLAADLLISQDKSEWEQKIQQYRDLGFTDSEAFSKVLAEQIKDTGLSFLGGALSGGVMGGGGLALNHVINNHTEELLYAGYAAGEGTDVNAAAQDLMGLQRKLSIKEQAGEKLTEDDQKAYTAAVDQLKSAMDALDPEVRRDLMKVGRETRKEMARDAKAAKKAAKQVSRMVKETAQNQRQTETTETVEAVEQGGTESTEAVEQPSKPRYSDNATVQQAAELVAEGRTSKAVTTVMQNAEAQVGLGLDFSRGATNMEKRTAIKTALEALVRENTETPVEVNNSTEASPETGSPAAVSAETETETETRGPTAEDSSEEATAVVPNQLISYETFAKDLREGNPDVTEEESRALYKEVQQAVEASQYATERDGQKVYLQSADRVVDYKEFREMALAEAKRNGATYEEAVIRDAFDTAFQETQTGVQEHETRRREKLNKTAENINKAFDARELGFRVRVSYDGADFAARGVKENAFVDVKNHEIVFNGDVMDSSGAMLWYLGHEVFHPAADVDTELVDTVIDTFQKLLDAGKLTGRLAAMVRDADAKIARTRELYQRHENELAEKAGRKAETISEAQAREEFAADLMRYAFSSTQLCKDIVGQKPTVAMRMRQAVSRVLKVVSGGDSDTSLRDELQKLADRLDAALERVSDNVKNADVEALTADNMSSDDLSGVTDTKGERMFSLSTMRQDIDGYMQDLRDAGLVGEGKVMTEAEVTGLYDGINRVMNFVEKHIDEIERNENYRDMTAETRPFSPYKPNSDPHYKMALDFSTLCRKRLLTQAITERLQKALGRALTPVEQVKIRDMIKKLQAEGKKIDVACALCYVEAARLKSPKVINDFLAHRADNIWNYHSLQDKTFKNDVYAKRSGDWKEQHGLPRNATKDQIKAAGFKVNEYNKFMLAVRKNYQNWLQQNNPERFAALEKAVADAEALDASAFLSAQSLARMRQDNPDLYDTFITKVRQATRSKAQETDVPYVRGDVNQVGEALIEQMNEESGFRHQSWSDFQAMHLLDSIAAIIELSTRKAKMHTYTKVADMVRFLGNTGMMMNMSLIPAGETGFDENGNLLFDPVEGMEYQTMLGLRRKFHATAGNIAIGISDAQILAMMASDEIDYIIPYHTSGLNADMRKRMGIKAWQDYTKSQNEKGDDWDKKAPKLQEWYNEKDALLAPDGVAYMVEASKKYLQLCHERNLTPKFAQFLQKNSDGSYTLRDDAQNYWKLLIDRKMVDQYTGGVIAQQAVVPRFDVNTMLDILSNEVNSQAAKDAREAEDYIVQKVLENGEGIVSKAERAELENRARILRDAALRGIVQNAAEEMGFGKESTDAVDDRQFSISMHNANSDAPIPAMDNTGAALTTNQVALFNDGGIVDGNGKLVRLYRFEQYGGARKMNLHKHGANAYFLTTDPNVARSYQTGTDATAPTFSAPQDLVDYLNNTDKKYSYALDGSSLRRVEKATGELDLVLRYGSEAELTEKALTDVMNAFGTEAIGTPEMLEGYARVSNPWYINADYKNWNSVVHPDLKGTYRTAVRNLRTDIGAVRKALYEAAENVSPEQVQELLGYYFPDGEVTLTIGEQGAEDTPGTVQCHIVVRYNWSKNNVDTVEVPFDVKWNGYDYLGFSREAARAVSEAERILNLRVLRSTDELAQIARDRGYDSIILDNVTDVGGNTDVAADTYAADIILLDDSPNGAQFKLADNKNPTYGEDFRFSIDPNYASDIDIWEKNGQPQDWAFTLGSTGDVLQGLGAQDRRIYMNAEKILQIQQVDHPGMTTDVIKKLPEVLENPALILKSRRQNSRGATDRLVVYGSLKDANGAPVAVILDLDPQEGKLHVTDCYKVVSAYGKDDENAPKAVKKSYVMYADKKRAPHLLRALGFTNPSARTPGPLNAQGTGAGYSFTGSINNADRFVNTYGKPFSSIFSYDETAAAGEDAETAANRDYSLSDNDQTDYDPNDDPMMQAFFDAYEEAHGEGQTKIDYPTLNQRLRAAERARKKAEVQLASEQAKRSLAEAETKDTRLAWQIYAKKMLRTKDREYRAKMSALRREKMEAVKAAIQQTRETERATAAVKLDEQKMAERMNAGRKQAAMRQGVREDTYARKAKEQDNAKLRRNAAKAALRNKNLAENKREKAEIEQGPVSTLRKTAKERKAMENRQNLGQKLRTKGRALYRDFVNKCMAIDFDVSRRQRGGMKAGTLATIVGSVGSTTETMFTDALVDRAGNRIGESMTNVFLCTEGDKGKVIDENRQRLLQDYMLHRHNIDRMSIVANTRARLEAFEAENPWLSEMDGKEFARLVALTDKEAEKSGQTRARELARQYGDLLQEFNEARDKPVFPDQKGNPVTAETSREKVEQYEAENPWLKDKAEGIYKWWDSFMRAWVVGDSITEEQYDRMRELYPHYVPTYRVDKGGMGFSFTSSNGATPGQLVKKATGSLREIVNIEDSFANLVAKAVKQARVNELYKNLVDTAMLDSDGVFADCMFFDWLEFGEKTGTRDLAMLDVGEQLELREKAGLTKDGSGYRVSAWYDGELVPVYVSEDLFQSLSDTVGASIDKLDKVARLGSKLTAPMKTAITGINVNFGFRNVTRDLPTAIINSSTGLAFPYWWFRAAANMELAPPILKHFGIRREGTKHWQHYLALGGGNALYYNTEGGFGKNMNMEAGAKGAAQRGWDTVKEGLGWLNETLESVTRFAEYLATVERQGDTYEARLQGIKNAAEVTVDFSRHGRYGKAINAWIPYWNPAVQGIDKVIRSVVETPEGQTKVGHALRTLGRAAVTTALLDAVMQLIYNALGKRDDWDELDDRTKDTYYCIPTGDHTFLKIPKNREWGAILGTPLMRLIEGYNGRENPFENYIETSIIPNFLPGMPTDMIGFSQYIDLATNKDFAGRTIVPYAYQQGSKAGQYDSETSGLSHWLSDRIGNAISPMQLDYIIKDYFGDFGKMFTMATSEGLWSGEKTPEEVADYALDIVKKPWEADNRFSNQYTSRYYETISQLEDTYNDKKNHSDGESYKDSVEYRTYQAMNKLYGKQISEINKSLRDETDEEAKAAGKAQIVQLAKQALAFYDDCMSGKVSNPELTAAYSDLPGSVSDELIRLNGLAKEYKFLPSANNTNSYVDPTSKVNNKATREYVLDDEAKAKLNGLREEHYVDYFQRVINTQAYKSASDTGKAELLEEARDNAYEDAKEEFMAWLFKNRKPTPKK